MGARRSDGASGAGADAADPAALWARPCSISRATTLPCPSPACDAIFFPFRRGTGGSPATFDEVQTAPALTDGSPCPAADRDVADPDGALTGHPARV